jgi:phage-related protein
VDQSALREFETFPNEVRTTCLTGLTIAAEGGKADIAKSMQGLGSGVFEIPLPFRSDAFRVVYAVQPDDDLWVVHAFQKKSIQGIKTAKHEIDRDQGSFEETQGSYCDEKREVGSVKGKRKCLPRPRSQECRCQSSQSYSSC